MRAIVIISVTFFVGVHTACVTPKNTPGECVPLQQCPSIYNVFQQKLLNQELVNLLKEYNCGYEGRSPKVCCENDAGPCVTASKKAGVCVPLRNCDNFLQLLEQKPFLNSGVVDTLKKSECQYQNDQKARVCCPFVAEKFTPPPKREILPRIGQCGNHGSDNKLLGGNATDIYEFPWMALLEYGSFSDPILGCGGTLISSRYVLTAAHCVTGQQVAQLGRLSRVRLGEYDISNTTDCIEKFGYNDCTDPPKRIDIEQVIVHEEFSTQNPNRLHDIALIRLRENVKFTDFIKPVCLPPVDFQLPDVMTVVGWGQTETAYQSVVKLKVQLPLYNRNACVSFYNKIRTNLGPGQICVGGERGKDSCTGDSGGPSLTVVQNKAEGYVWYQVGIVSFGPVPCGKAEPGVYTLVPNYLTWIQDNIQE